MYALTCVTTNANIPATPMGYASPKLIQLYRNWCETIASLNNGIERLCVN